jgi:3'-5' exoribonuclease 1
VNFIIFDLEATCWAQRDDSQVQEIIEIGALLINRYGEAESTFNSFIKPIVNPFLSDFCTELTNMSHPEFLTCFISCCFATI